MEITVTGRKKQVTDRFRRHLEEKLDKIPQLSPRVSRTDVVLTHEANPRQAKESERVEITCYIKRTVVRAEAAADDDYAALDLAMNRLLERLRRSNDRRRPKGSSPGSHSRPGRPRRSSDPPCAGGRGYRRGGRCLPRSSRHGRPQRPPSCLRALRARPSIPSRDAA